MASIFQQAVSQLKGMVLKCPDIVISPATSAPVPSVVLDKSMSVNDKRLLGGSIVKMSDGTHRALSMTRPCTTGAVFKVFGTESGSLAPPASEIDITGIDKIALGVLTDKATGVSGARADSLVVNMLPAKLYPVLATGGPFTELEVELDLPGVLARPAGA